MFEQWLLVHALISALVDLATTPNLEKLESRQARSMEVALELLVVQARRGFCFTPMCWPLPMTVCKGRVATISEHLRSAPKPQMPSTIACGTTAKRTSERLNQKTVTHIE